MYISENKMLLAPTGPDCLLQAKPGERYLNPALVSHDLWVCFLWGVGKANTLFTAGPPGPSIMPGTEETLKK